MKLARIVGFLQTAFAEGDDIWVPDYSGNNEQGKMFSYCMKAELVYIKSFPQCREYADLTELGLEVMQNPIPTSGYHPTLDSIEDLEKYASKFNGNERLIADTLMRMALNVAHKLARG